MTYSKINWVNNNLPAINDTHLNHMDDQIALNERHIYDNQVAIANLNKGVGGSIQGTKHNTSEIFAITGAKVNDIWIDGSTGHGYSSDGLGGGSTHWRDVGLLIHPGSKGDKGDTGVSIDIKGIYNTVAHMEAANPNPSHTEIEIYFVKENGGEFWAYEDTVPPHDGTHATWHKVADHIQGAKGDKGDTGVGQDGHDGKDAVYATQAETTAGTLANKAVTPKGLKGAYLPLTGGTLTNALIINHAAPLLRFNSAGANKGFLQWTPTNGMMMANASNNANVRLREDGDININPKAGKKLTYKGVEVATLTDLTGKFLPVANPKYSGIMHFKDSVTGTRKGSLECSATGVVLRGTGTSYIYLPDTGNIKLRPANGKKVTINQLTGTAVAGVLSGTVLSLYL